MQIDIQSKRSDLFRMRDSQSAPVPGTEEGFQSFLKSFGPEKEKYTEPELRAFYRDMIVLVEILFDLYREKEQKKQKPISGMPPIPMLARSFDSVRFPGGMRHEPPWGWGPYRFEEGAYEPIRISIPER